MGKFVLAKQMAGKNIVTNGGDYIGKLIDLTVNEVTGKLESILVEPNPDSEAVRKMKKEDGLIVVPYDSVLASSDFIVIDRKGLSSSMD
ncbi:MAG TPA: PRC-barrel domain-containing protein [Candidatus Micrarchaeota archaeon]|nr:PRC-barrel domain-containing protein [Candidatus Micrarchaeota archaeon]